MIALAGLQCGFGEALGPVLGQLSSFPFHIVRIDLQRCDQAHTAELANEVLLYGLQPLCIVRRAEQIDVLPEGALIELGNEPDLEHEGWTPETYAVEAQRCIDVATARHARLYLGAVSNLNFRGLAFLDKLPWAHYPSTVCCSIHRYPNGSLPTTPHDGFKSRGDEVLALKTIVGYRPLACSEVGYYDQPGGPWTEADVAAHMKWERQFFSQHDFEIVSGYQINDGPTGDPDYRSYYGFRRHDGSWKPVATAFTE
jgi:hypothetical protein